MGGSSTEVIFPSKAPMVTTATAFQTSCPSNRCYASETKQTELAVPELNRHHQYVDRNSVLYGNTLRSKDEGNTFMPPISAHVSNITVEKRPPLHFRFCGYTIWLEPEQFENDLSNAMSKACSSHGLHPIPLPHITLLYGMTHLSQEEVQRLFRNEFQNLITENNGWGQVFQTVGVLVDKVFDGVDGEDMDIAWSELTLKTNEHHEKLVDTVYSIFYKGDKRTSRPWKPHLSLAYDNPTEDTPITIDSTMDLLQMFPSLIQQRERKIHSISLWDTNGTIQEWKCLERISLQDL